MARYKSRKQKLRFVKGKTVLREKLRRKAHHVVNPATGRGEWKRAA